MSRPATVDAVEHAIVTEAHYRCMCCDGVIANLSEESIPTGLDLKLGLVADECALICNACTMKLIEARKLEASSPGGRR
jgi:hypothetical protein